MFQKIILDKFIYSILGTKLFCKVVGSFFMMRDLCKSVCPHDLQTMKTFEITLAKIP